mgnify:CR=1 FL=1
MLGGLAVFRHSFLYVSGFLMSLPVVDIPPALYHSHSGITYAIAGSVWVEVPRGTLYDELPAYITYKPREVTPIAGEKSWNVKGSKGNIYTVKLSEGVYSCSCPGYGFRRKCRHITEIKNESR